MSDGALQQDTAAPLAGVRIIEFGGIGPVPYCAMLLARLGADILRIERPDSEGQGIGVDPSRSTMHAGRARMMLDIKAPADLETFFELVAKADILLEGMRPGVAERRGIGPEDCRARNPALIYCRMSGWRQDGPLAARAGHDINYIAQAGLLGLMGPAESVPVPPLTLGADFAGGMWLGMRALAALRARGGNGAGVVIEQSLEDAAAMQAAIFMSLFDAGLWTAARGANLLDGGAPFYRCYATADGKHVAVGALEDKFYRELLDRLDLKNRLPDRRDRAAWPEIGKILAARFAAHDRDHWTKIFAGSDACVSPVLAIDETAGPPDAVAPTLTSALARWGLEGMQDSHSMKR